MDFLCKISLNGLTSMGQNSIHSIISTVSALSQDHEGSEFYPGNTGCESGIHPGCDTHLLTHSFMHNLFNQYCSSRWRKPKNLVETHKDTGEHALTLHTESNSHFNKYLNSMNVRTTHTCNSSIGSHGTPVWMHASPSNLFHIV